MQLAEATKEKGVVMTSCPSPTPAASMAQCRPAVPDETPTACRRPVSVAHACSNSSIFGPIDSVDVLSTSTTASISSLVMSGCDSGIVGMAIRVLFSCGTGYQPVSSLENKSWAGSPCHAEKLYSLDSTSDNCCIDPETSTA